MLHMIVISHVFVEKSEMPSFIFIFICTNICVCVYVCVCVCVCVHACISFQVVHSRPQDLLPKPIEDDDPELQKPDEDTIADTTEKTRAALEKLVSGKISAAMPVRHAEKQAPAQYIRWVGLLLALEQAQTSDGQTTCRLKNRAWIVERSY